MECIYDQEMLEARCRYWAGRLRLLDWEIKVEIARAAKFGEPEEAMGEITMFPDHKKARIQVVDPIDWADVSADSFTPELDHEYILVHELVHLVLFKNDDIGGPVSEYHQHVDEVGVYLLAHTLVNLDRELREAYFEQDTRLDVRARLLDVEDDAHRDCGDRGGGGDVPGAPDDAVPTVPIGGGGAVDRVFARRRLEAVDRAGQR